ncbi:DUF1190 domain-containing protein [Stenotrophomonas sp. MMGLT7]|uniref:DUF1190 domain-containing protein n=1 Tax=Stenotrophomonas sp. MMGLT7 TaxID=2901227 RepID=UPI001E3E1482|nr:DUF1190 domain-containing protein [Stenotrophomonas sp. MMGLT7]MCD7100329.1 DUF1190 domain-containing protein [Stenotrophomonas sp. MMGLT7]
MKRSRTTTLLLMGAAPLLFSACQREPEAREGVYTSVESCAAQTHDITTCQKAAQQAQQQAAEQGPRYASQEQCEQDYGAQQCAKQTDSRGHSFIGPLMTGFFLSQMLNGNRAAAGFNSAPAFRDKNNNWARPTPGAAGGVASARTMTHIGSTPDRAVTRAATVSRGGFGSSGSGRSVGG